MLESCKLVVPAVLVYLVTSLCCVSCIPLFADDDYEPHVRMPRTLYGTPEEKFFQFMAYHRLKVAVKMQKIECYKSGVAELPDSFLGAIGKGWSGQNCTHAYRSCDRAKNYVRRIVDAVLNTKPDAE
ncbi:hypothetical protein HPB50_020921 [Hyalomma asiaticum]|uniref:Uncharacterized protein n=1 Tax=Hyalomma asiaticum TaxID=266040 RepID=A0ACB7SRN5_HYAAI|nr:hypothetical protein HPB50_020921 [Hyalomma asiaticum]